MEVGIKRAKSSLSKLVGLVQNGDRVFLTNHGERVAELVPVKTSKNLPPNRGLGMYKDVKLPSGFGSQKQRRSATNAVLKDMDS